MSLAPDRFNSPTLANRRAQMFPALAQKLKAVAGVEPRYNAFLLKAQIGSFELTVFADGRAIVKGGEVTSWAMVPSAGAGLKAILGQLGIKPPTK